VCELGCAAEMGFVVAPFVVYPLVAELLLPQVCLCRLVSSIPDTNLLTA
jgi:hypothetical protein